MIVTWHAPPEGSVVGKEFASFEQLMDPMVNADGEGVIAALASTSPDWPSPIFDTAMTCVPAVPAATDPKPTVLGENDTTGAITLINGVMVTASWTVIISLSKTSGSERESVT